MSRSLFSLIVLTALSINLTPSEAPAQAITLQRAVDLAQSQGHRAHAAAAARDAARARDHAFGARLLPQLSFDALPDYRREIEPVVQPDGSVLFTAVQSTRTQAGLSIGQELPFTGGRLSIGSSLQRYEVTGGAQQRLSWSSTPVTVTLNQPLMRSNSTRWNVREQHIRIDVAERQYLEAREAIALQTSNAFFDLYVAMKEFENATTNAAVNDTLFTLNKGRYEVGKIGENDLLQSELALLRSRSAAENAKLDYERALAAFRLAVAMPATAPLDVTVSADIPDFEADTLVAVAQALRNRSELSDLALQEVQSRRRISEARLNTGLGANVSASIGFNQTAPTANLAYRNLLQAQRFAIGVSVPLVQWGARNGDVQAALFDHRRVEAMSHVSREQLTQEAHFAAMQLTQATRNVALSAKADTVASKRFEVAYNRYVIGRIGIDNLYLAQSEKDQAFNQYLQALRSYWSAYYRLRQVTLYDFERGAPID